MIPKVDILGVGFHKVTMKEATNQVITFLDGDKPRMIFTANPEFVMTAQQNNDFMKILNQGDLVVPDGIGIIIASKWLKTRLPERVTGYDLIQNVFDWMKDNKKTAYFLGSAPGIAEKAAEKMMETYPGLKVVGYHDGYFDAEEEKKIIEEIKSLKPNLLLVGVGAPKQEFWINNNLRSLNINVAIGVGGALDVMSGHVNRAPKIFIRFGLEWFYRLITQPTRIKRMIKLPIFLVHVLKSKKRRR